MSYTIKMNQILFSNITIFLASFLIWFMFAGLIILWVIDGRMRKEQVLHTILAMLIAWTLSTMIKSLFPSPRPFEVNGAMPLTLTTPSGGSFPSNHAAVAFSLAVSIWLHNKKVGNYFLILAVLVGTGRMLGNVHYFLDILGGAVLGIITAVGVEKLHLFKLLKK